MTIRTATVSAKERRRAIETSRLRNVDALHPRLGHDEGRVKNEMQNDTIPLGIRSWSWKKINYKRNGWYNRNGLVVAEVVRLPFVEVSQAPKVPRHAKTEVLRLLLHVPPRPEAGTLP